MSRITACWVQLTACAVALGAPVFAQDDERVLEAFFARYDRNGDGRVERSEFPGSDAQFTELDADADGGVDFAEFARSELAKRLLVARKKDAEAPRARVELEAIAARRLEAATRFDGNRDGRVTLDEWRGPPAAFAEIDLDRDGDLDRTDRELAQRFADAVPGTADPVLPDFSRRLDAVDAITKKLDRDRDGKLSRREVLGHAIADAFAWADANGDDSLDVDELRRLARAVVEQVAMRDLGHARPRAYRIPFDAWDANDDDRLEPAEWRERKYLFPRIDQDRDAVVTREEILRYERSVEGTTFVDRFDLNGDGRVTLDEFGGPPGAFRRADKSGDGTVSRGDR